IAGPLLELGEPAGLAHFAPASPRFQPLRASADTPHDNVSRFAGTAHTHRTLPQPRFLLAYGRPSGKSRRRSHSPSSLRSNSVNASTTKRATKSASPS